MTDLGTLGGSSQFFMRVESIPPREPLLARPSMQEVTLTFHLYQAGSCLTWAFLKPGRTDGSPRLSSDQ